MREEAFTLFLGKNKAHSWMSRAGKEEDPGSAEIGSRQERDQDKLQGLLGQTAVISKLGAPRNSSVRPSRGALRCSHDHEVADWTMTMPPALQVPPRSLAPKPLLPVSREGLWHSAA